MNSISTVVIYAVIALGIFALLIAVLAFLLVRRMGQAVKEKELHNKHIRETVIQTQELERSVLADNLHDDFGPQLSFLFRQLRPEHNADESISITPLERSSIYKKLDELISDIRKYTSQIYPTQLKEIGLMNALEQNLFDIQKNIEIRFFNNLDCDLNFDDSKELAVYRIANEVLNNILRHGKPTFLDCEVNGVDGHLQIVFTHDGVPFSQKEFIGLAQSQNGRGCSSILNRTLLLEGTVEFYHILDQYACVNIQIPMP
jgi:signal transduction histidine kinase